MAPGGDRSHLQGVQAGGLLDVGSFGLAKLRPLWSFRARLDLASLSKGVEARAGAVKEFTGMLAVSKVGRVPLKTYCFGTESRDFLPEKTEV